jgi:hypothetical protein
MFRIKFKRRNFQKRIAVALALFCLLACAVDIQLYLEHQIAVNIVHHSISCHMPHWPENYFDMSINELMDVVVISQPDVQPSSYLLNFRYFYPNWVWDIT